MKLQALVCAVVHAAVSNSNVRVDTQGIRPEAMFAFHVWRATWWVTRDVTWRQAPTWN